MGDNASKMAEENEQMESWNKMMMMMHRKEEIELRNTEQSMVIAERKNDLQLEEMKTKENNRMHMIEVQMRLDYQKIRDDQMRRDDQMIRYDQMRRDDQMRCDDQKRRDDLREKQMEEARLRNDMMIICVCFLGFVAFLLYK